MRPPGRWTVAALRPWTNDIVFGATVTAVGLTQSALHFGGAGTSVGSVPVALAMGAAAGLFRCAPGYALLLVWAACVTQVASGSEVLLTQLAAAVVAYGTARHGRRAVVWLSGLSIPIAASVVAVLVVSHGTYFLIGLSRLRVPVREVGGAGSSVAVTAGLFMVSLSALPWLAGLAVRARAQAERSAVERTLAQEERARAQGASRQAQQIADLRAGQARLARDVHDVVGHSLAVILVQAESAQFLPDDDAARIRQSLQNIAVSARQSLREVREVLSATADPGAPAELDTLLDRVRQAGNEVRSDVLGPPRPLRPEVAGVAFRVLQEMLTNAIKHGRHGEPIRVTREWREDLRMEVGNVIAGDPDRPPAPDSGLGLEGIRRRLAQVGGHLEVSRGSGPAGPTFAATAWIPTTDGP